MTNKGAYHFLRIQNGKKIFRDQPEGMDRTFTPGDTRKIFGGVCRWDSETLNLYQTTSFQLYFRLDAKYPHPILSIVQKSSVQYSRIVFSMENRLSINKVAVIEFTFISGF